MEAERTINDKKGNPIGIHELRGGWSVSAFQRDCVYQEFLRIFPDKEIRFGICKERRNDEVMSRARQFFDAKAIALNISSSRILDFVSQAVATEAGFLPKSKRWDWWVGCSIPDSSSASSASSASLR